MFLVKGSIIGAFSKKENDEVIFSQMHNYQQIYEIPNFIRFLLFSSSEY